MSRSVWLINLYGTPAAPSSFNPDNSLASLAGSLKERGYKPLIIDYQTVSFCEKLIPKEFGSKVTELISSKLGKILSESEIQEVKTFNQEVLNYELSLIDEEAKTLIKKAHEEKPLFIGLKLYSGEGSLLTRRLASRLKEKLNIPLVGGGPLIRVVGSKYMEFYSEFDYLIDGEAENSIWQFAEYCENKRARENVAGLIWRTTSTREVRKNPIDKITDMSKLADPCYDQDVYPALYQQNEKTLVFQIDESRGCPNKCHFCVHPVINGNLFRTAPVEKIINQIKNLQNVFGARAFRFTGSNTPKKFLKEFAVTVNAQRLDINYSLFASVNTTDETIIPSLKSSGLVGVFIGVETTDQNILKNVFNKRGQSTEKAFTLVKSFLNAGIFTTTSWIYPMPNFTPTVRNEVRDFILKAYEGRKSNDGSVIIIPSGLVPNSEWFFNYSNYGFEIPNVDEYYKGYIELVMKYYLPKQLMGTWNFKMQGKSFTELAAEAEALQNELKDSGICFGISDDWMLLGRLSGLNMQDFKSQCTKAFLEGDYSQVRKLVKNINTNANAISKLQKEAA